MVWAAVGEFAAALVSCAFCNLHALSQLASFNLTDSFIYLMNSSQLNELKRRMAAWVVAIGAVAAYNYYESSKVGEFTKDEQEAWNKQKKEVSSASK